MPREITKTVYTYQELLDLHKAGKATSKAIDRAKDWLRQGVSDYEWYDCLFDRWTEALAQIGFSDAKLQFRGFWSQGDGASFTADIELDKLADFLATDIAPSEKIEGDPEDFRPWLVHMAGTVGTNPKYRRLATLRYYCNPCKVERTSSHYCHENTCKVSVYLDRARPGSHIEKLLDEFEKDAEALRLALSKALYRDLETDYDYLTSDESLAENAESNGYTFTITGAREG
jgi:hypothetical protein